ncbi:MAG: TRAP transporter small permease, partial [Rhodospirillales bacterium]|nr:TRAP transporter small permease [Rhodospirillales bacterium]
MSIVQLSDKLSKFLMVVAAAWAFGLTFVILSDIIGRGVFNAPVYGVREIVMNSIVIIVFLQAGYAIRSRCMLKADFLITKFPEGFQRIAKAVGYLLGAAFFLLIIIGTVEPAIYAWTAGEYEGEGALRVPVWPTKFMILFGSAVAMSNYLIMTYLDLFRPELL